MAELDQLTKEMNREAENAQVFLTDPPRCPASDLRLCRCPAASYTRARQRDAKPTDRYIGTANLNTRAAYGHAQANCNGDLVASGG